MKKEVYIFKFLILKKCTLKIPVNMPDCAGFMRVTIIGYITTLYSMKQSGIYDRLLNRMPGNGSMFSGMAYMERQAWSPQDGMRLLQAV